MRLCTACRYEKEQLQAELDDVAQDLEKEEQARNDSDAQTTALHKEMEKLKLELDENQAALSQARAEAAAKPKVGAGS